MQRKSEERKGDLRNASVLEVIVAIIIVLVILLHSNNLKFTDEKDVLNQEIKILTEKNVQLSNVISELKKVQRDLKKTIKDLERKVKLLQKFVDASVSNETLDVLITENITLNDKNSALEGQLAAAKAKLKEDGKTGIDKPFCRLPVVDKSIRQKHKWLGRVSWSQEGILFDIDPALDLALARSIPGVENLESGSPLTSRQFEIAAKSAFIHSKRQDPECRYNVIIQVDPAIDPPSSFIIMVETYFYKGVRRL
tara:strand:- start:4731 stop:5489 length:759 start_codon:yes stop_codon:yes gene_type:complete